MNYFIIKPGVPAPLVYRAYKNYEAARRDAARLGGIVTNARWLKSRGFKINAKEIEIVG